ncbi:hypothetical protein REISMN_00870 [Rickettsia tamurae subsp. buchneri]|uniref:Uncharacterized protein n=1 Tax=Rickettsia tamurae subsp. buchneri TaxID=1462938 RepID=A0A8E1C0I0_9RICK|nr:hypothetical protein REISMN_00870 [Rickettsia tamurae subsp. buchneri]
MYILIYILFLLIQGARIKIFLLEVYSFSKSSKLVPCLVLLHLKGQKIISNTALYEAKVCNIK